MALHRTVALFSIALLFLIGPQLAQAGVLNGHVDAFNDGTGLWPGPVPAAGAWTGSTAFTNGSLMGDVDWAVFGPGDFPAGFLGYTPTSGELTYSYQVFTTGTSAVTEFDVALNGPADNIDSFLNAVGEVAPTAELFVPAGIPGGLATWQFNTGIGTGQSSYLLVFSSPNIPENFAGLTIDDGLSTLVIPVPTPSVTPIPEPSTLVLAGFGFASLLLTRVRRRRK